MASGGDGSVVIDRRVPRRFAVVGAGVVGVSCALMLQRDGHTVTLVDRDDPGRGASFGNAGVIAHGVATPMAMPGLVSSLPRLLADPDGPVVLRWRHLPRLMPWLVRIAAESRPSRAYANAAALATLARRAREAWVDLLRQARAEDGIRHNGWLKVYESGSGFDRAAVDREFYDRVAARYDVLRAEDIRQMEPALAPIFPHALYFPEPSSLRDPFRSVERLVADFVERGGAVVRGDVTRLALADRPRRMVTRTGSIETDAIVIAAGAWSRDLARQAGADVALDTERGYHLMLPHPPRGLARPVLNAERRFLLAPMEDGCRLTSSVEFASLDAAPDYARVRRLLPHARRMLPGLDGDERSAWLGRRPTLPDSRPVIGESPRHRDVYLAFGHQHYGLTLGPVTGAIIADMAAGRDPGIDLRPFRPDR
jgi:D-amino-acid dehydrogenase